jgi:hypothetical protein
VTELETHEGLPKGSLENLESSLETALSNGKRRMFRECRALLLDLEAHVWTIRKIYLRINPTSN